MDDDSSYSDDDDSSYDSSDDSSFEEVPDEEKTAFEEMQDKEQTQIEQAALRVMLQVHNGRRNLECERMKIGLYPTHQPPAATTGATNTSYSRRTCCSGR